MKTPFSRLHVCGGILFAARGGNIHSFNLDDGSYLSTWKHPDVDKVAAVTAEALKLAEASNSDYIATPNSVVEIDSSDAQQPPAKRLKVEQPKNGETNVAADDSMQMDEEDGAEAEQENGKKKKKPKSQNRILAIKLQDRPLISLLTSSPDESHIIAVSGHDKSIFVLENCGQGVLNLLSQR
jgi:tRNA (guanine-N(7)-)-methyltransferase subunit TRM82